MSKRNFKSGGSYIDSPDWMKKKKATINLKNTDDNRIPYAATLALNYEEIESHPERVSIIEPFIDWELGIYLGKNKLSIKNR